MRSSWRRSLLRLRFKRLRLRTFWHSAWQRSKGLGIRCSSGSNPYKKCTWHKMRKQLQVDHCPALHAEKISSPLLRPAL